MHILYMYYIKYVYSDLEVLAYCSTMHVLTTRFCSMPYMLNIIQENKNSVFFSISIIHVHAMYLIVCVFK